jgi:DNA modification methylase
VFDPCLGTGTTLDAAIQLYRAGAGCDRDLECCKATSSRLWKTVEQLLQQSSYFKLLF